ncbi:MAG TPA: NYN domain-containing protein [Firmicutes bacterium]|nr:NYN domain-containing protein [Bacillota bacterium]
MNNQNRIALFVDIDNMPLGKQHIDRIISQLEESGEIAYAKFYGVTDRRHRDIICDIAARGFEMAPPVNPKKRGSTKVFDNRILVDLCELVFTNTSVSSVAIVANPTNLVHLFARLKREDVGIYACDNLDDDSLAFVDEILRFGYDDPNTAAKKRAAEGERENAGAFKIVTRRDEVPSPEDADDGEGEEETAVETATDAEDETAETESAPAEETEEYEEAVGEEPAAETEQPPEEAVDETPSEEPQAEQPSEKKADGEDADLGILKEIQRMKDETPSDDDKEDAELIEKIKKLLDEFN